ncbi:putative Zn finger-like uncharacterized protein [Hasllibacter halocynthiae]|uniref:Putative Zn finger-like uncharacterized protein n=1 Tax=Hasllibacter halocynthiae TaxID=595589 RepID=A0A2T0X3X5_9RHOB|nr:zinc-ribbon domain-containing protein [Hasllibacter halocynthiae]PRY93641.1 putative Zn finger-like uncharacterized protein [Hasllibacter halocynthiae]
MRLRCPSCDAVYDVPEGAVPPEGRDVQCTNCDHLWFQEGARADDPAPKGDQEEVEAPPVSAAREGTDAAAGEMPEGWDEGIEWPRKASEAAPTAHDGPRLRTPADVADIDLLREEAERERRARAAERRAAASAAGSQVDPTPGAPPAAPVGLVEPPSVPAEDRIATGPKGRGREALPDVDEINSSLRPAEPGEEDGAPAPRDRERSGFRAGFIGSVLVFALAVLFYGFAPDIGRAVPALAGPMDGYVGWVNGRRATLDAGARDLAARLSGLADD